MTATPLAPLKVGVILAGGQSRRMGTDKALLSLNGVTLLERAGRLLEEIGCDQRWVSGFTRPFVALSTLPTVPDLWPNSGPVGGIVSSLLHLTTLSHIHVHCWFIPIDMPLLDEALLRSLSPNDTHSACHYAEHPLPFYLSLSPTTLPVLYDQHAALTQGESCSIRQFLAPFQPQVLLTTTADRLKLMNVNDPQAWEQLQSLAP